MLFDLSYNGCLTRRITALLSAGKTFSWFVYRKETINDVRVTDNAVEVLKQTWEITTDEELLAVIIGRLVLNRVGEINYERA